MTRAGPSGLRVILVAVVLLLDLASANRIAGRVEVAILVVELLGREREDVRILRHDDHRLEHDRAGSCGCCDCAHSMVALWCCNSSPLQYDWRPITNNVILSAIKSAGASRRLRSWEAMEACGHGPKKGVQERQLCCTAGINT